MALRTSSPEMAFIDEEWMKPATLPSIDFEKLSVDSVLRLVPTT